MYARNSVWMMRTTITTEGGADRSVEASSWEEASDGAVSEAVASEAEVSAVAASEVEVPEVNSNPLLPTFLDADYSQHLRSLQSAALSTTVGSTAHYSQHQDLFDHF